MAKVVINEDGCKGCGLCISVCPKKIMHLSDRFNKTGYHFSEVKPMEECIGCASCAKICPDVVIEVYK